MTARGDFPTLGQLVSGGFVEGYEEYFGTAKRSSRQTHITRSPGHASSTAPGGVDRVAPGDDLTLVAEAVGETVVAVSESRGWLTVATQRVGVYSLAREDGPLYVVEERWSP